MGFDRFARNSCLMRGGTATAVAVLVTAALAGGGQAVAAAHRQTAAPRAAAAAGTISTVAGGVGGPGTATQVGLAGPCGVSFSAGRVYVADSGAVRVVNPGTDRLTTPVGTEAAGPGGNGGPATNAGVSTCDTVLDHFGNLVIADGRTDQVRLVPARTGTFYGQAMTAGHIYPIAGTGHRGFSGDRGPAIKARFRIPDAVAVDAAGNLVIGDAGNFRIRVVAARTGTFYGQAMTAGDVYTIAGTGPGREDACKFRGDGGPATSAKMCAVNGIALDAAGNVVFSDSGNNRIRVIAARTGTFYGKAMTAGDIYTVAGGGTSGLGDGGPATSAQLTGPGSVAFDSAGNMLIADTYDYRIRVVPANSGTFYGQAMTAGHIYTIAGTGIIGYSGDGGPATKARLKYAQAVALDGAGNVLIAVAGNGRVRVLAARNGTFYRMAMTAGHIYTVAGNGVNYFSSCAGGTGLGSGDGGPAIKAQLDTPTGLALDAAGNLLIADRCSEQIRAVAARSGTFYGQAMTAGDVYRIAGTGQEGFSGDGGSATVARFHLPGAVAVDQAGNLVISDALNYRVRVVAATTGTFYGIAMTAGDIYTIAGNGRRGFSGSGGPATSAEVEPGSVATDAAGNLVIGDGGLHVRVVAATTGTFYGQAMTAGDIYAVAGDGSVALSGNGGPATKAGLSVASVVVDAAGNLLIGDWRNNRIRVVAASTGTFYGQAMTAGDIYTIAGHGHGGYSGDGGPATKAELAQPAVAAVDASGNVVIDVLHSRIRIVAERTGTFYGKAMTAGDIYALAGNGSGGPFGGFSGDGGPATKAELSLPGGMVANAAGNLLIADTENGRIRMVTG
jgi:hypothetical protein